MTAAAVDTCRRPRDGKDLVNVVNDAGRGLGCGEYPRSQPTG
jgi:hypothetical protein